MGLFDLFKKDYVKLAWQAREAGDFAQAGEYFEKAYNTTKEKEYIFKAACNYEKCNDGKSIYRCVAEGANVGHPMCLEWMGELYRDGYMVQKSTMLADQYFRLATMAGCVAAYHPWGNMYNPRNDYDMHVDGGSPMSVNVHRADHAKAMSIFQEGLKHGCAVCPNAIGDMYARGLGVKADINEAAKYFKIAADRKNGVGCLNLALYYYNGWGGKRDDELAYKYFIEADKYGSTVAAKYLSKDKTKLRSHLEMGVKEKLKEVAVTAAEQLADNIAGNIVDSAVSKITK